MSIQAESVTLFMTSGKHHKTYQIYLIQDTWTGWWNVNFAYGRIGSSLKNGTKTPTPLGHYAAKRIYDDLLQSILEKGCKYSPTIPEPVFVPEPVKVPTAVTVRVYDVPKGRKFR